MTVEVWSNTEPAFENLTVARTALGVLLCPSERQGVGSPWAGTNYRTNMGVLQPPRDEKSIAPQESLNGAFTMFDYLPPSAFGDGTSTTVAFSEKPRGSDAKTFQPESGYWHHHFHRYSTIEELVSGCSNPGSSPESFQNDVGNLWLHPAYRYTQYNHNLGPNAGVPDCTGIWNDYDPALGNGLFTARSYHPGGVNAVYADGHAGFVANGIASQVWRALGTRSGGEAVSAP